MTKKRFLFLMFIAIVLSTKAQFNFFVGDDASKLKPSIKGFGSISFPSFMMNASTIKESSGKFNTFYSVNFGFNWKQWRFADNIALEKNNNNVIEINPAPATESYTDGFFSYTKTKLSLGVIRIRPEFGIVTKNKRFSIGTGPLVEFVVAAKHKRKFYDTAGAKEKTIKKGISYYNINWFQFGWGASIGTYHFGAFSYIMLTSQFKENLGPKVHAAEVGLYWRLLTREYSKKLPTDKFSQL
jgi:hypothetical protein